MSSTELTKNEMRIRRGVLTSCRCFRSWGTLIDNMTDEEAGKVWKLIFQYLNSSRIETADMEPLTGFGRAVLLMATSSIEDNIDREIGKAHVRLETKEKNARKRETESNDNE